MYIAKRRADKTLSEATTINVHREILAKVDEIARFKGVTRKQVLTFALELYVKHEGRDPSFFAMTQYQPRGNPYKVVHITFTKVEYEWCFDLRKFFKLSLSLLFALAVNAYAHKLLESEFDEDTCRKVEEMIDNYRVQLYLITWCEEKDTKKITYMWKKRKLE